MLETSSRSRLGACITLTLALAATAACGDNIGVTPPPDGGVPDIDAPEPPITEACAETGGFADARAHFVNADTIAFPAGTAGTSFELAFGDCNLRSESGELAGADGALALTESAAGLPQAVRDRFPHLAGYRSLGVAAGDAAMVPGILKGQFVLVERDGGGAMLSATRVQIPGALDALFAYDGALGVTFDGSSGTTPSFTLWAPTARSVEVHVYDRDSKAEIAVRDMTEANGVWSVTGDAAWYDHYYKYEVEVFVPSARDYVSNLVTDPYSVGLSTNSEHTLIVNLDHPDSKPAGWDGVVKPALDAFEDISLYELHLRDFSISDATVPAEHRGTFMAFTHDGNGGRSLSNGMNHLIQLAQAGLTHIHLLPLFDIATVNEVAAERVELDSTFDALCAASSAVPAADCTAYAGMTIRQVLASLDPTEGTPTDANSANIQRIVSYMYELDGFNWGYDPFHYTAPEGSYATDPEGTTRILEFRRMVQALNENGLRMVMDVVYNHTNASGQSDKSVLDRIVPGYCHRLNQQTCEVERSTCCDNTATENAMMNKLMVDSVVTWARHFKVDGFRFDLMGHHLKSNMVDVKQAVSALTMAADGVDGSTIYLYGEGWNFGEVANNARGVNATQLNMPGTGIGTFSDRLRDGVRGGGPFDGGQTLRDEQGFATGLCYDPNRTLDADQLAAECNELRDWTDVIRAGMAGNLANFIMADKSGIPTSGADVSYHGSPAAYTLDPQEVITYISAHDNQTLWDNNQYKLPAGTGIDDRVRSQNLGMSIVVLGQGIPFMHAGGDMLRSKSFTRDSYNSGDWFNALDFSYQSNNWNVGLPRWDKDGNPSAGGAWDVMQSILSDSSIAPQSQHIQAAAEHYREMLRIRTSSPLFRLRTQDEVTRRVDYHNVGAGQIPGLIVQSISDGACAGPDLDPNNDAVVVLVNANDEAQTFTLAGADRFELHPEQAGSQDAVVRTASFNDAGDTFSIPARTTAVFVQPQLGAQGSGIGCNSRELVEVYLRGDVTTWDPVRESDRMARDGSTTFSVTVTLEAGSYLFKIASDGWAPYNWGIDGGATIDPDGAAHALSAGGGDITIAIAEPGNYEFTLDHADFANPTVAVERVLPGLEVYVRGNITSWDTPPPASAKLIQDPSNDKIYRVALTIDPAGLGGPAEFKIADADWTTYNWGIDGGNVTPNDGVAHAMAHNAGNITLDVAVAGTFVFTLDVTDIDSPTIRVDRRELEQDVYVRGEVTTPNWDALEEARLVQDPANTDRYTVVLPLAAMSYYFKVADASWSQYNWGAGATVTPGDAPIPLSFNGSDISLTIGTAGNYRFVLDASNLGTPTVAVEAAP